MSRPSAVAAVLGAAAILSVAGYAWWPSAAPALPCGPAEVHLDDAGVARCGAGALPSASQRLTVGQLLDLNTATIDELEAIPGLGVEAARALVEARTQRGPYHDWTAVDAVHGIGPGRLGLLQRTSEIRGIDAGAW